jgi:hypothetical protein
MVSQIDRPSLAALSFVWGDLLITENIELDGATLPVITSLAAAFRHFTEPLG